MSAPMPQCSPATAQERREKVVTMTRAGMSAAEIALHLGIAQRSVVRIRKRCGIAKPKPPPLTAEELAVAKALLEDGASRAEAARSIGRNQSAIEHAFPGWCWTRAQQDEYLSYVRKWRKLTAS